MSDHTKIQKPLPDLAAPAAWQPLRFNEVEAFRRLDCPHYSECLSYCAGQAWLGFTCIFCPFAGTVVPDHARVLTNQNYRLSAILSSCLGKTGSNGGAE